MAGTITATEKHRSGKGLVRLTANILCDAAGVATKTNIGAAFGRIVGVGFDPNAGAGAVITTSATLIVYDADSGAALITYTTPAAAAYFRPSAIATLNTGVALTAGATITDVNRDIFVAGNLAVAITTGGGNATTGALYIIVQEG